MPKLNVMQTLDHLEEKLSRLEAGEELAKKEVYSLLTPNQRKELDDAWKEQQELRKVKRARTAEEEKTLGWKTKREVRIDVYRKAIQDAEENFEFEAQKDDMERVRRQMKIYMEALDEAKNNGKDEITARNYANNKLTSANLPRMDHRERLIEEIKQERERARYMRLAGGRKD